MFEKQFLTFHKFISGVAIIYFTSVIFFFFLAKRTALTNIFLNSENYNNVWHIRNVWIVAR